MVGVSKDCFTHHESVKFIDMVTRRLGGNLYTNSETKQDWLSYGLSPGRPTVSFARKHIIRPIEEASKKSDFPLYILLNLITGDDS